MVSDEFFGQIFVKNDKKLILAAVVVVEDRPIASHGECFLHFFRRIRFSHDFFLVGRIKKW